MGSLWSHIRSIFPYDPLCAARAQKKSVTCLLLGITLEAKIDKTSPLSQWCILHSPYFHKIYKFLPNFRKIYTFPPYFHKNYKFFQYFHKIYTFPPISTKFTFLGLIYVFWLPPILTMMHLWFCLVYLMQNIILYCPAKLQDNQVIVAKDFDDINILKCFIHFSHLLWLNKYNHS